MSGYIAFSRLHMQSPPVVPDQFMDIVLTMNSSKVDGRQEVNRDDILLGNIWREFLLCGIVRLSKISIKFHLSTNKCLTRASIQRSQQQQKKLETGNKKGATWFAQYIFTFPHWSHSETSKCFLGSQTTSGRAPHYLAWGRQGGGG